MGDGAWTLALKKEQKLDGWKEIKLGINIVCFIRRERRAR